MPLEVLLGEVLEVSLGEGDVDLEGQNLILDGLGAVNDKSSGDLGLSFLGGSFSGLGGGGVDFDWCLFCGHCNIIFILLFNFASLLPSTNDSLLPSAP